MGIEERLLILSKKCLILGSGFGLYGYLPAVVRSGYTVVLPEKYRDKFNTRTELVEYSDYVDFCGGSDSEIVYICKADLCIIAKRPADQYRILFDKRFLKGYSKIVLEKPLAKNPTEAINLYKLLEESGRDNHISYRVGYTFLYTIWGEAVICALKRNKPSRISIVWSFMAHHFIHNINTWKRYMLQGGGALRFYGIQLVGLLSAVPGWRVCDSVLEFEKDDEPVRWRCTLACDSIVVDIILDSINENPEFNCVIEECGNLVYQIFISDPFETEALDNVDRRVGILEKIVTSFDTDLGDIRWSRLIGESVRLWKILEAKTMIVKVES